MKIKISGVKGAGASNRKKLWWGLGIAGGVLLITAIVLILVLSKGAFVFEGKIYVAGTDAGCAECVIYVNDIEGARTDADGKINLTGKVQIGDELVFSHPDYLIEGLERYTYTISSSQKNLSLGATMRETAEERLAREGVTLNFVDNNNNAIKPMVYVWKESEFDREGKSPIASTNTGKTIVRIDSAITLKIVSQNNLYLFDNISVTTSDKNSSKNCVGTLNTDNFQQLECKYVLEFENGDAFVNKSATIVYTYYNLHPENEGYVSETLSTATGFDDSGRANIQFTQEDKVLFTAMQIFIKDNNNNYWFAKNVAPTSSATATITLKSGKYISGTYRASASVIVDECGLINCDSTGKFWFVTDILSYKFYNDSKTKELKLYDNETLVTNLTGNMTNLVLK